MPLYEFICTLCGHRFEELLHVDDPPVRKCPKCGHRRVERLISAASFRLKPGPSGGWSAAGYSPPKPKEKEKKSG
jgi:putative FmdB family regulatory protein